MPFCLKKGKNKSEKKTQSALKLRFLVATPHYTTLHPAMLVRQSVHRLVGSPLLGSGPEGVDDLRPPLKSQSWGPNSSLEAQIPVFRPKS